MDALNTPPLEGIDPSELARAQAFVDINRQNRLKGGQEPMATLADDLDTALPRVRRKVEKARAKAAAKSADADATWAGAASAAARAPRAIRHGREEKRDQQHSLPLLELPALQFNHLYQMTAHDIFRSGLAAKAGPGAFAVWSAMKSHADFQTGHAFAGIRKLALETGQGSSTVDRAIKKLIDLHLLRQVKKGWPGVRGKGRTATYIPRERVDVHLGGRLICSIVVDYVPSTWRDKLGAVGKALQGGLTGQDLGSDFWAAVDIIPGPGFAWDQDRGALGAILPAGEVAGSNVERSGGGANQVN